MNISAFGLRQAIRVLHRGGIIAYPTEAVYGLGCDPMNAEAVYRLLALKQRAVEKGLILVAAELQQLLPYMLPLDTEQQATLQASWPGPNTWVVPAREEVPVWIRGTHSGLAVRVSAHPLVRELCKSFGGPIISTSANISGHPAASSPLAVRRSFGTQVDYIIHAALGGAHRPSQIRDLLSGAVLRPA